MADQALDVFISYSHGDEAFKDELVAYHLNPFQRDGKINAWQDRDIEAGADWAQEIEVQLDKAEIILLLVTRKFLASDYGYTKEMTRAIERHRDGTARVIPIILEPCSWRYSPLKDLQVLPKDGKPVIDWPNRASAFYDIEEGIRRVIDTLNAERLRQKQATEERLQREREAAEQRQRQDDRRQLAQAKATYEKNLQRYEQEFSKAIQAEYPLSKNILDGLKAFQQQLDLEDDDIISIEQPIRDSAKAKYQQHLRKQEEQKEAKQQKQELPNMVESEQETNQPTYQLQSFEFDVATLNDKRQEANCTRQQAQYFQDSLGQDVWLDMVSIPGGSFLMGSPLGEGYGKEKPQHQVTVQPFFMGKFPVTQAQWRTVAAMPRVGRELQLDPSSFKGARRPVESVYWHDAVEFCQRLERYTGRHYRLPSETEWEYACRAGTTTPFHFGSAVSRDFVNCERNLGMVFFSFLVDPFRGRGSTTEVGSFNVANSFGLYDMHGNVWEWCADHWHDNYKGAPIHGTAWLSSDEASSRLVRGGSLNYDPSVCRSANRYRYRVDRSYSSIGFRVACSAPEASLVIGTRGKH